jgi:DNA-binding CsgD family transcriptional regulator
MSPEEIASRYFYPGTRGHIILRNYYAKYRELFVRTLHHEFEEFLNQILLNVASINFSGEIENLEAYIMGTIKIQCRVQLDRALKLKSRMFKEPESTKEKSEEEESFHEKTPSANPDPQEELEGGELFRAVNIFKLTLKSSEVDLLNSLIDGVPRKEIAENHSLNLNTLDTQIRRLRVKFLEYLKNRGYSFEMFGKFDIN